MKPMFFGASLALLSLFVPQPLPAHHSTSTEFDLTRKISLTGTLTKVDWINPHIMVEVSVDRTDGRHEAWTFESGPPTWFETAGVSRTDLARAIGQTVTVEAAPAKDGSPFAYLERVTFADGVALDVWRSAPKVLNTPP